MHVKEKHYSLALLIHKDQSTSHRLEMGTSNRVDIGNWDFFNGHRLMSRKIQVVESDDVIGANHKVEIISKAERVQENPLRLGVLESDLVTFLFFYEEQCELSV